MKLLVVLWILVGAGASAQTLPDPWKPFEFLLGEWVGEGAGKPGEATSGGFTFALELDRKILVRRNFAVYPAARHEDLMVIEAAAPLRATYWDNEGHVIRYRVAATAEGAEFVSEDGPGYRLSYRRVGKGGIEVVFEVGSKVYVIGRARKK